MYKWLKKHLYNPLGYKKSVKFNYPDILHDLVNLDKSDSMIHPEMTIPDD